MKKVCFYGTIFFAVVALNSPAMAAAYYNSEGKQIAEMEYEKVKDTRASTIQNILSNGYGNKNSGFKDPVLLRKKRIEQWKAFRNAMP